MTKPDPEKQPSDWKEIFHSLTNAFDHVRNILRTLQSTKHPEVELNVIIRIFAHVAGLAIFIFAILILVFWLQPTSLYALYNSVINEPVPAASVILFLTIVWTSISLFLQANGLFHEHLIRSATFIPFLLILVICVIAILGTIINVVRLIYGGH